MAAVGIHAEPDHHARADADGRHRDRRRHHRARKYLSLHGREGHVPVRGRHRRDARHRFRGHGDDAFAARRFPSGRIHGRHRRPVHELIRAHLGLRHRGVAAGVVHPHADAVLALRQEAGEGSRLQRIVLLPHPGSQLHQVAGMGDGPPQDRAADLRSGDFEHRAAVHDGRQELRSGRRSVAIQRADPHARGHFARRDHESGRTNFAGHPAVARRAAHSLPQREAEPTAPSTTRPRS